MTLLQFFIPFIGVRPLPDEVAAAVGLEGAPATKYKGFVFSWFGYTFVFAVWESDEQDEIKA